jgi:hypothetical protein
MINPKIPKRKPQNPKNMAMRIVLARSAPRNIRKTPPMISSGLIDGSSMSRITGFIRVPSKANFHAAISAELPFSFSELRQSLKIQRLTSCQIVETTPSDGIKLGLKVTVT